MEAVGQLSGGIAHDFNNILTVIQGNAALLQSLDLQPAEIRDCSNQIARAGERAASLTRQLLMFARKQQMQPVNLDLNETVAQMTKMLQRILGEDITLRSEYAPGAAAHPRGCRHDRADHPQPRRQRPRRHARRRPADHPHQVEKSSRPTTRTAAPSACP